MKKYVVFGGHVISKNDGQWHKLSAFKVAELYGVNPSECVFINDNDRDLKFRDISDLVQLYPQNNPENYRIRR